MEKYICIHGHFYQPPRENAWLEAIEVQDSAHPYHDWNERISAECYGPNAASRILNEEGAITNIVNNYAKISYNFGPTLLSWMEQNDREAYDAILEADRLSIQTFGHGSALAQVYNHMIMPLANSADKETQVVWGIRDFVHRFNRQPEGMWLAETAVDTETLEVLVRNDIRFTILAPRQAKSFRKLGEEVWTSADETFSTRHPYICRLPSGNTITLFFYDGDISQAVAFNGLLNDGRLLADRLLAGFDESADEVQLCHIATDGETYGHHHKHGDMALAFCLDYIERNSDAKLTNYAQYLSLVAPAYEIEIHENSSWSCVHGVERWRNDCGCNTGGKPDWHQRWRQPLRDTLDWLREELWKIFEQTGALMFKDPVAARNDYINVILKRSDETIRKFMREHCSQPVEQQTVLRCMEVQRNAMLMYTSCGWFFDEVSGIETTQILEYACRAMQLTSQISQGNLEREFLTRLHDVPSNVPAYGNGAAIYNKVVLPSKINLKRVGMHYAVASIFEEDLESFPVFNYATANEHFVRKAAGEQRLVLGVTKVRSNVTRSEQRFTFVAIYLGKHNIIGNISLEMEEDRFASMQARVIAAFQESRLADVIGLMQTYFGSETYTIWQLFQDEKRKVFNFITQQSLLDLEESLRRIYNRDYPLVTALANNDIPIPNAYRATFEYILNADLLKSFGGEKINIRQVERVMTELATWDLAIEDPGKVEHLAGESIFKELKRIGAERDSLKRVERLNRLFPLLVRFNLRPNLYRSQNLFFEISRTNDARSPAWLQQFTLLGENMGVKV